MITLIRILTNKFNNLNIFYKLFITFIVIIIFLIVIGLLSKKTPSEMLRDHILKEGYNNDDGGSMYYKQLSSLSLEEYNNNIENNIDSEYILSYIDIDNYEIKLNYRDYIDNIDSVLNLNYKLSKDVISFKYRVVLDNSSSAIFSGKYYINKPNDFICNKDYTNNFNADDNNEIICNKIKNDIIGFQAESYKIIPDNLLKEIKNE